MAPVDLADGGAAHQFGGHHLLLHPYREGGSLWGRGLTDRQWVEYGDALLRLAETVDELASRVPQAPHVICHADIHPGNLIADGDGPLHVVDWDAPILRGEVEAVRPVLIGPTAMLV
ncbi:phosphotransferase [Micromonospora sp. WMMD980]|uniref:phosphotransferase family protein n=1 Tax=Micromonospora sp. WMMD980 TaxID=3016088 RepID=UPI002416DC58|nr:phosphotransferase [Micromonospora sp. WMMD980]MDG4799399.1 phosphotransferase [Micromonospora sp. WMMD980]